MKLRQTFAVLLLIIALVLSGVVYGQLEVTKQSAVEQVESSVNETATLTAAQIDEEISRQCDYVGYHASRAGASNVSDVRSFMNEFLSNPRFYAVQMIDANGTVLAFHGDIVKDVRRETEGANLSDRPYVSGPLSTGDIHVSEPKRVNATGQYVIVIGAPIFDGNEVDGVLAAAVELNRFTVFSTIVPLQTASQSVSVTDESTVLYPPGQRFQNSITGRATVATTDWTVEVQRDRTPLESRLQRMALLQGGSLLLVLFAVIGLAVWEYSVTLRQTEELLDGFEALRSGNYDHQLTFRAAEEWEKIGTGFNDFAATLEERERAIREREQHLSVLNRVLRHNLRNEMTLVLNHASLIAETGDSARVREAGRAIEERGRTLIGLGESAREATEAMTRSDETIEMDLAERSEDILASVQAAYPEAAITIDAPERVPVAVVPTFERAIRNVIENAFEHNDAAEPRVTVTVRSEDGYGTVSVADNGPGIPSQETMALDGTEEPLQHGSGLGLWVTKWLVQKSSGWLEFAENDSRGTVVTIYVPRST